MASGTLTNWGGSYVASSGDYAIKFPNGMMICQCYRTYSLTTNKTWGSLYYDTACDLGNFPATFVSGVFTFAHLFGGTDPAADGFVGKIYDQNISNNYIGKCYVFCPVSHNDAKTYNISILAIGRWKW